MKDMIIYIRYGKNSIVDNSLEAVIAGFEYLNVPFDILYEDQYEPSEIAVVFGCHKNISKAGRVRKVIYDTQNELGKKLLVIERGFVNRKHYHSIGWNGINGNADFKVKDMPSDRFGQLNINLLPWKTPFRNKNKETIILCGQVPWDSSVQHLNSGGKKGQAAVEGYLSWLGQTARQLQAATRKKEIVFRPHPLFGRPNYYQSVLPPEIRWDDSDFETALQNAWACAAFNSNAVVEAMIQGVHGFVADKGAISYPVANKDLSFLQNPNMFDRVKWLSDLAYCQWTLEELSKGMFWEHLNGN